MITAIPVKSIKKVHCLPYTISLFFKTLLFSQSNYLYINKGLLTCMDRGTHNLATPTIASTGIAHKLAPKKESVKCSYIFICTINIPQCGPSTNTSI